MKEKLLQHIQSIVSLTIEETDVIRGLMKEKDLPRKHYLLRSGEIVHYSAFVVEGCLRSYAVDRNGVEHVLQFAPENWWISDMYSVVKGEPSIVNIDALVDTKILYLTRDCQLSIFDQVPKMERYFRILTENALAASNMRTIDYLSLPAKVRYEKFCTLYPGLINSISLKFVASYIGITPEFLSKLRAERGKFIRSILLFLI